MCTVLSNELHISKNCNGSEKLSSFGSLEFNLLFNLNACINRKINNFPHSLLCDTVRLTSVYVVTDTSFPSGVL